MGADFTIKGKSGSKRRLPCSDDNGVKKSKNDENLQVIDRRSKTRCKVYNNKRKAGQEDSFSDYDSDNDFENAGEFHVTRADVHVDADISTKDILVKINEDIQCFKILTEK